MGAIDWKQVSGATAAPAPTPAPTPAPASMPTSTQKGAINWNAVAQSATQPAPQQSSQQQVLDTMSPSERFLAGIGGGMVGLYEGAKQRLGLADQKEIDEYRSNMDPLANTRAGFWGSAVGTTALTAPALFIPGANTAVGAALVGGSTGALQPTKQGESVGLNAAAGAAGGVAGKYIGDGVKLGAKKLGQYLAGGLESDARAGAQATAQAGAQGAAPPGSAAGPGASPAAATATASGGFGPGVAPPGSAAGMNGAQAAAAAAGKKMGMKLTPGQATGSVPLQQVEAFLESHPETSGPFNNIRASNQKVLNQAAAGAIGENSSTLDSTVLARAADRIGNVYDQVRNTGGRAIDPDAFLNNLAGIEKDYEGLIGDGSKSVVDHPLVRRFMGYATNGQATAEQLSDLGSKLTKASNQQMTSPMGDRQLGMALGDVKQHVDDLLQAGLPQDLAGQFSDARGQYRNLMLLTGRQGIVNPANGNVSGRALAAALQAKDRTGYLFGQNDSPLYQAARFTQAFPAIVGDSGTATRMGTDSLSRLTLTIPGYMFSRAYTSTPGVALAKALSTGTNAAGQAIAQGVQPAAKYALPMNAALASALLQGQVGKKDATK